MERVNSYSIDRKRFASNEEFAKHMGSVITNMLDDGYICVVNYEDCGIYTIDYEYADRSFGCPYPYWLAPEEVEAVE